MAGIRAGVPLPKRACVTLAGLAGLGVMLGLSCLDRPPAQPDRGNAPGATAVAFRAEDGVTLNGSLWARDPRRAVIYLHEYRDDQSAWWPTAEQGTSTDPSALTVDFRGHGTSEGSAEDVRAIPRDARAALAFARERGYQRVVLVGAGMGAAAAMIAAADDPTVGVLGLSAPSEFAGIRAIDVVRGLERRVALLASDGDLSARHSVEQFRIRAAIPAARVVMFKGIDHGVALLTGDRRREAMPAFRRLLGELWQS